MTRIDYTACREIIERNSPKLGDRPWAESGVLTLDGDHIRYASKDFGNWEIKVRDLLVVGELTNQDGPFVDDWWLAFVTEANGHWYEASVYASGVPELCKSLGQRLGVNLEITLAASADFKSNILWPAHLQARPLLRDVENPPTTLIGRVFNVGTVSRYLTDEVLAYAAQFRTTDASTEG